MIEQQRSALGARLHSGTAKLQVGENRLRRTLGSGGVAERTKVPALKAGVLKGTVGSNPTSSAQVYEPSG
jgi:hypothetical protein